jgi:4-diphosphocytidyl-2-C-methyl-D-erythritol kinase
LVNPLKPSPTGAVYRAYDDAGAPGAADQTAWPAAMSTVEAVAEFLGRCRNDLEAPAISLQPAIAEVLEALRVRPETRLARMSGSGATCFAICADPAERVGLAAAISASNPSWWVMPCVLAGCPPRPPGGDLA